MRLAGVVLKAVALACIDDVVRRALNSRECTGNIAGRASFGGGGGKDGSTIGRHTAVNGGETIVDVEPGQARDNDGRTRACGAADADQCNGLAIEKGIVRAVDDTGNAANRAGNGIAYLGEIGHLQVPCANKAARVPSVSICGWTRFANQIATAAEVQSSLAEEVQSRRHRPTRRRQREGGSSGGSGQWAFLLSHCTMPLTPSRRRQRWAEGKCWPGTRCTSSRL